MAGLKRQLALMYKKHNDIPTKAIVEGLCETARTGHEDALRLLASSVVDMDGFGHSLVDKVICATSLSGQPRIVASLLQHGLNGCMALDVMLPLDDVAHPDIPMVECFFLIGFKYRQALEELVDVSCPQIMARLDTALLRAIKTAQQTGFQLSQNFIGDVYTMQSDNQL